MEHLVVDSTVSIGPRDRLDFFKPLRRALRPLDQVSSKLRGVARSLKPAQLPTVSMTSKVCPTTWRMVLLWENDACEAVGRAAANFVLSCLDHDVNCQAHDGSDSDRSHEPWKMRRLSLLAILDCELLVHALDVFAVGLRFFVLFQDAVISPVAPQTQRRVYLVLL
jgi:hypothetical protein